MQPYLLSYVQRLYPSCKGTHNGQVKEVHYDQDKFIPVSFQKQILPCTFEYTLSYLLDHEIDQGVFDARYRNDESTKQLLRRGTHRSVHALKNTVLGYLDLLNGEPKPFC